MQISIPAKTRAGETRVAATAETVKKPVTAERLGVLAVALAAVNVFGGFLVTRRMLEMFKTKEPKTAAGGRK